jgi:hypothetical protein
LQRDAAALRLAQRDASGSEFHGKLQRPKIGVVSGKKSNLYKVNYLRQSLAEPHATGTDKKH